MKCVSSTLLRDLPVLLFPLQLPQSFSPAFIWLVWRAIKKLSATRRKWWSQFSHKPRIMPPELLLPFQSYFANAIKCWSEGTAFLTGWEIISLSLLNQSNLKPQIMWNVIQGCFVDINNNPTFNLRNLSQNFGVHVNCVFRTPFKLGRGKKITHLIFSLNHRVFPMTKVKSKKKLTFKPV